MSTLKILFGDELVKQGVTRLEANLPELGLKDVVPNGSWLEQKQIQAALEAKKHLIQVERIEKRGSLSHAEWKNDLMLAEVTQKSGSYWQYLGHNVGRILYLKPEEALFLMEINCLQLTYGGVKVSLQQAYSLLLQGDLSVLKYRVYASLSRIGYKAYRHKSLTNNRVKSEHENQILHQNTSIGSSMSHDNSLELIHDSSSASNGTMKHETVVTENNDNIQLIEDNVPETNNIQSYSNVYKSYQNKLLTLRNRKWKQCCSKKLNDFFNYIPDLLEKRTVTLKVPESRYIPNNIILKDSYTINLRNIPKKCTRSSSNSLTYSSTDEANGSHVKRLRTASTSRLTNSNNGPTNRAHPAQLNHNNQFRSFHLLRPQSNLNYFNINMLFQRPFIQQIYFPSPFQTCGPQFFQRTPFNNYNSLNTNAADRYATQTNLSNREVYLERIKNLALRLKNLVSRGNVNQENTQSLQRLLNTYNSRYKTNLRLGPCFEIIRGGTIVETIELDLDEDEPRSKKRRINDDSLEDNLKSLKQMALELKTLEINGKATARHRRTFSKVLKTFNRCYNVDYYLNAVNEIINRSHITLDSSSDTDCMIEEETSKKPIQKNKKSKKLRNPFNILKRLSEKQDVANEGNCSTNDDGYLEMKNNNYSDIIKKTFNKNWLPNEKDFGRAEICEEYVTDPFLTKITLLYDFAKYKPVSSEDWLGLKIAFLHSLKETIAEFHDDISMFRAHFDMDCLVKPEDYTDTASVLKKLRIIKTNKEESSNLTLNIDFDVYNRDVENFKKSDPPTPHFRVICLDESSKLPSASEIEVLRLQYKDNVPIVFALVSVSSISYLQVKPVEIPVHTPSSTY